jgi:membrane-associated protein
MLHSLIDFVLHLDVHLTEFVASYGLWTYGLLFLVIFCETGLVVTPFLPGDSLLFLAGALAARPETGLNPHLLVVLLVVAAVAGDAVNYLVGKYFGQKLFANPDSKIFRQSHLQKTHDFFERYGGKTIVIARFIPVVRTLAPLVAGMARMNYRRFALYNVTGGILWVVFFIYAGFAIGNLPWVQAHLKLLILGIMIISVMPAVIEVLRHWWSARK